MRYMLIGIIYLTFISLGMPDALLGTAWPVIYGEMQVPISYASIVSIIISGSMVFSSLQADRFVRKFGAGKMTAIGAAIMAGGLFGISLSGEFIFLCLWAIPYGFGAGIVDVVLNNYVALHYSNSYTSWLHCMWGVGASISPYIMRYALTGGSWHTGYRAVAWIQFILIIVLVLSFPMWKGGNPQERKEKSTEKASTFRQLLGIPGVKAVLVAFFCYGAIERTAGLWISSYFALYRGFSVEAAAGWGSLFFIGITVGRGLCGVIATRVGSTRLVQIGQLTAAVGLLLFLLPLGEAAIFVGLTCLGLGIAPIYPCNIHATPGRFGANHSQAIIGMQMAGSFAGKLMMPTVFGWIADYISIAWLPIYLLVILFVLAAVHQKLAKVSTKNA